MLAYSADESVSGTETLCASCLRVRPGTPLASVVVYEGACDRCQRVLVPGAPSSGAVVGALAMVRFVLPSELPTVPEVEARGKASWDEWDQTEIESEVKR